MRYESLPRKIMNGLSTLHKYLKEEFGNWAYAVIAFVLLLLYKPIIKPFFHFLDVFSSFILYGFVALLGLFLLYWLFKKIFR